MHEENKKFTIRCCPIRKAISKIKMQGPEVSILFTVALLRAAVSKSCYGHNRNSSF